MTYRPVHDETGDDDLAAVERAVESRVALLKARRDSPQPQPGVGRRSEVVVASGEREERRPAWLLAATAGRR